METFNGIIEMGEISRRRYSFATFRKILKDPLSFLTTVTNDKAPALEADFIGKKYFIFQHPHLIKHVLLDNHKDYYKPGATKLLSYFLGEGLSTSNGSLWKRQRRIMQPAFHKQRLQQLLHVINEETTALVNKLKISDRNEEVNITHEFLQLTIRIISRSLFSTALAHEMDTMIHALEALADYSSSWMKSFIKIPLNWPTPANKRFAKNCNTFNDIIYKIINDRKKDRANGKVHHDLLDMLMDHLGEEPEEGMSMQQLKDEMTTMFMAGHETTAQTLSWIFHHIAKDKEIYETIRTECANTIQSRSASFEDLPQLIFTTQVISEALRKYPPIWAIVRKPLVDDLKNGLTIPTSANVLINIYGMHHHPTYWENPNSFCPAHFSAIAQQQRPSYVYLPFGGGPRLCIGSNFAIMVMQVVVNRLTQAFAFEVPDGSIPEVEPNITLRAKGGIKLIVKQI